MSASAMCTSIPDARTRALQAYERALPTALALSPDDLLPINIDLPGAVATTLSALPKIRAFAPRIARALPELDLGALDALETYALAASHAHALQLAATAPLEELAALADAGTALRNALYTDALALAIRDLLPRAALASFRASVSHKHVASDLARLAALLREHWPRVAAKTAIRVSELARAEVLAAELTGALSKRERALSELTVLAQHRQRLFTLLVRTYDSLRRGITYLRWHEGDIDSIAPSLYAGRRKTGGGR